jgi:hypothetical protein
MTRHRIPAVLAVAASLLAVAPAQASTSGKATARFKAHLGVVYKARWHHASGSWVRRWRRTPSGCGRVWGVAGTIYDNDHACNGDMAGDIERALRGGQSTRLAFVHGTNTAGFGKVVEFHCHRRGVSATCANAMGDAFRVVG